MDWLRMLRSETAQRLILNHQKQQPVKGTPDEIDFPPVCKLFVPWAAGTWLLTEMDEDGLAFGLCDIGHQCPELGHVSLDELWGIKGPGGLRVEEDIHFRSDEPISKWATRSREQGYINA